MKKITLTLVAILFAVTGILAQTPNQFKYQAVLRDASGTVITNEAKTVVIDILQGSAVGTSIFNETHNVTTSEQGLINLNIGSVNSMSSIDWSADTYFIQITVGSTIMGTSQLLSVPYAIQAKTAETIDYANVTNTPTIPTDISDLTDNTSLFFDRDYNSLTNLPTLFDGQWSSLIGTTPNISTFTNDEGYLTSFTELDPTFTINFDLSGATNGDLLKFNGTKYVKFTPNYLTTEADGSVTNEIQDLSLTSNTLKITNNTSATNIDLSPYLDNTDDQTLTEILTVNTSAGNKKITDLADPINNQDAATKAYIDQKFDMLSSAMNGVTDYDGNHYDAVVIGNQIWMAENLKATHYPDGTAIPLVTDNTAWGNLDDNNTDDAYCYYNNNASNEKDTYGALYTWAAAMGDNAVSSSTNPSGVQGVCPSGWHLPSDAEWTELTDYLGGTSIAGGKMKETGTTHWTSPNTGADNSSGFSALPGGFRRSDNGTFVALGNGSYWVSATESGGSYSWINFLYYGNSNVVRNRYAKSYGYSVRCLKD